MLLIRPTAHMYRWRWSLTALKWGSAGHSSSVECSANRTHGHIAHRKWQESYFSLAACRKILNSRTLILFYRKFMFTFNRNSSEITDWAPPCMFIVLPKTQCHKRMLCKKQKPNKTRTQMTHVPNDVMWPRGLLKKIDVWQVTFLITCEYIRKLSHKDQRVG